MKKFVLVVDSNEFKQGIVDAILRIGNPIYHKYLVRDNEICLGGGDWEVNECSRGTARRRGVLCRKF